MGTLTIPFDGTQACMDLDTDLFFPDEESKNYAANVATAKRICSSCVLQTSCLEYALSEPTLLGIWGGTDLDERKRIRRRARRRKVHSGTQA